MSSVIALVVIKCFLCYRKQTNLENKNNFKAERIDPGNVEVAPFDLDSKPALPNGNHYFKINNASSSNFD